MASITLNQNQAHVLTVAAEGTRFQGMNYGTYKNVFKPLYAKLAPLATNRNAFIDDCPPVATSLEIVDQEVPMLKTIWQSIDIGFFPRGGEMEQLFDSIDELIAKLT